MCASGSTRCSLDRSPRSTIRRGRASGRLHRRSTRSAAPTPLGDGPGVVVLGMPGWSKIDHEIGRRHGPRRGRRHRRAGAAGAVEPATTRGRVSDECATDRPASYRDVTVLIRSRTRLGVLEHTLRQAGVPYRVEGGTLIYGSREVYELLRVLRAVDDPTNQLKVVTALRTSIFGIDDRQLMQYRLGTGGRAAPVRQRTSGCSPTSRARRRRAANARSARPAQARAHACRTARRAVRRLARRCRGAVRRRSRSPARRGAGCAT